ncbi:MAG: calcium/sodium antiporter [Clostridia bacterium]
MIIAILCVLIGFVFLVVGADKFVSGASSLAKKLGIPSLIIGLTIVSFGTSAPELTVGITAALSGSSDIAVGNVVGSNIFNILMVLGVSSIIMPIIVEKELLKRDLLASIIGEILVLSFLLIDGTLSRIDAIILLAVFAFVFSMQIKSALKNKVSSEEDDEIETVNSPVKIILLIVLGLVAVIAGAKFAVYGATEIARLLGMSEAVIGLTVVAIGTSLPEFVTSTMATKKGETSIAIGNVVGANLFNIFLNLGLTSFICPITPESSSIYDVSIVIAVSIFTFIIARKGKIERKWGLFFVACYIAYTAFLIVR